MASDHELRPAAALTHPLWLASLAALALNDHVLKGSVLLPSAITGKLSDITGLIVAPALLAALLRVRRPASLLASHLVVGLVFAAIQLSAAAADAWSTLMAALGAPWQITRDPSDLLALPALLLAYRALRPAMQRPPALPARRPRLGARRLAEALCAALGLLVCVATSAPPSPVWVPPIWTDVYIHNDSGALQVVTVRQLRDDLLLDCDAVLTAPEALREVLFAAPATWALDDQFNAAAIDQNTQNGGSSACRAVLLAGDLIAPTVVTWAAADIPPDGVPGAIVHENHRDGAILLQGDEEDLDLEPLGPLTLTPLRGDAPPDDPACPLQSDADRLFWSTPVPAGVRRLNDLEPGVDGCFGLRFATDARWYVCAPAPLFPFQTGDWLRVETFATPRGELLRVEQVQDQGGAPVDPPQVLLLSRGGFPDLAGVAGATLPRDACPYRADLGCGTVARPADIRLSHGSGQSDLLVGAPPATVPDGFGGQWSLVLAHGQTRAILDPECVEGFPALGDDLEVAALYTRP